MINIKNTHIMNWVDFEKIYPFVLTCLDKLQKQDPLFIDKDKILEEIAHGNVVLWLVLDGLQPLGIVVISLRTTDLGHQFVRLDYAAGSFGSKSREIIRKVIATLEQWAVKKGALFIEICGRLGWEKYLKEYQFKTIKQIYRRHLDD